MSDYWKKKMDELNNGKNSSSTSNYWQSKLTELEEEEKKKKAKEQEAKAQREKAKQPSVPTVDPSMYDSPAAYVGAVAGNWISNLLSGGGESEPTIDPSVVAYAKARAANWNKQMPSGGGENDERTWFQKGALEDGVTLENAGKAVLGTTTDATTDLYAGALGLVEGAVDTGAYFVGNSIKGNYINPATRLGVAIGEKIASWIMGEDYDDAKKRSDEMAQKATDSIEEFIEGDLIDEQAVSNWIVGHTTAQGLISNALDVDYEKASILGDKSDSLIQSGGQLAAQVGLSAVGVPWWLTSGVSSFGSETENALKQGATFEEAGVSGLISAGAEILTEKISGGVKLPGMGGTLDDILTRKLATGISNKFFRTAAKMGIDVFGEGLEEALTNDISAFGQWLTYRDDEELKDLLFSEEAMEAKIEAFIGGAVLGGMGSASQVYKATRAGEDYTTGLTEDEFKVVNKAYNELVAKDEKASFGDKNKLWQKANQYMDEGRYTADFIESVLGGESYNKYKTELDAFKDSDDYKAYQKAKDDVDSLPELEEKYNKLLDMKTGDKTGRQLQEEADLKKRLEEIANSTAYKDLQAKLSPEVTRLTTMRDAMRAEVFSKVKDTRLAETYRELARSNQKLDMDATQYTNENARQVVQAVVDSGLMDNTNQSKRTVEFLAKLAADKGLSVEALSQEAINKARNIPKGYTVHGYISSDGKMTLNMESPRLLQTTAGHEITHIFEGTELYNELAKVAKDFCIAKEGLDGYNKRITEAEGIYGGDTNTTPEGEVVADIIGQYIFADEDFVNNLSANKDVFEKVYDEVKYLCKIAVAGSNEKRQLEKVKRAFDRVYQQTVKFEDNGKVQNSYGKYDRPKFNKDEWSIVNRRKHSEFDNPKYDLDNGNKWMYANEKGYTVFAVYSKNDVDDPTVLYGSSGKAAARDYATVVAYKQGGTNANRGRTTLDRLLAYLKGIENQRSNGVTYPKGTLSATGDVSIPFRQSGSNGRGDYIDGTKNLQETELAEYDNEASGNPGASSITFSNDYQAIRNFMKEGDTGETDVQYSVSVKEKDTLDFLNKQIARGEYDAETNPDGGYYVTYKSMSFWGYDKDGNAILRSPMAEYVDGELSNAYLIPKDKSKLNWYQATETIDEKTGFPTGLLVKAKLPGKKSAAYLPASENQHLIKEDWSNLYFNLRKKVLKNGKWVNSDVPARYNPYEHSSNSMLNDQFSAAYLRDNLVTVKMYVPISEDNGAFRAKWSKDPTGWADWKTGTVAGKINQQKDLQRRVYLSRYAAPVEIVPDSEVAQAYKEYLEGTDVSIPDNVVSPGLLSELRKAGVPVTESGKVKYSISKDNEGRNLSKAQADFFKDSKVVDENGSLKVMYHGTPNGDFTVFKDGTYFTDNKEYADIYQNPGASSINTGKTASAPKTFEVYLDIKKPFDLNDAEARDIYINEYIKGGNAMGINPYLSDAEYAKIKTIDWTEGEDLRDFLIENGYDYDGLVLDEGATGGYGDSVESRGTSYVVFSSEQVKDVNNSKPTKDPDIRFSMSKAEKAKMDKDYLDAVAKNDEDVLKHLVGEYAKQAMPETKLLDENGNPRIVYHGTNTGDFTVFNPDYIGMSSGDDGFFGMGFYFAYSKGEASYYGASRVIPAYLDLKNPFNFDKELRTYNGKKAQSGHAPDAVALMNFADKFPDIAMSITLDVSKEYGKVESISLFEFSKEFKNVIENKYFETEETVNEYGEKETIVTADPQVHSYEYNGETITYRDFGFQKRWYGTPNEYDVAYEYLSNSVYSYIDMPRLTNIILDNNREFTAELKNRGYDGTIQSEYGDEAVVFEPSQIKSAEPITYDDNGEVIPLSKRFDRSNDDIRYSMSKIDNQVNAYQYNLERGDMLGAEMAVEELANLTMPDSKIRGEDGRLIPLYHGTKEMFWEFDPTIDGGKNGTAEGFGIYLSDYQEVTNAYGDRQIKMFANITKPATSFDKTISQSTLVKLIKQTCERQAQQMVEEEGYDSLEDALRDTWISNYVMTYDMSIEQAYRTVANDILKTQANDKDIIHEVMFGMAIRDYATAMDFYRNSLTPVTGFDGFVTKWENNGKTSNIYMAFDSSQLKSADAVTKDDNGNVIPITDRFNFDKKDIRYSISKDGDEDIPFGYKSAKDLAYNKEDAFSSLIDYDSLMGEPVDDTIVTDTEDDEIPINRELTTEEMQEMFPDDMASYRGELSKALAEKAELEESLQEATKNLARAGATEQDLQRFEEVSNAYDAVVARISKLEQKVNGVSFTDYTDADAPAEVQRLDDSLPGVTQIGKGDISNIANEAGKPLALNGKQKAEFRKLIEEYSNSENPSREQLFNDIKEKFGVYTERAFEKTISEAKKYLRTTKLYLSDTIVGDIADFADFKYRNRGKVILSRNGGLEVDVAYKELNSYWPYLFPEDIINPTDQLLQMVDVASKSSTTRIDTPFEDKMLWEVANDVADSVAETKRLQRETDENRLSSDAFDSLMAEVNASEQVTNTEAGLDELPIAERIDSKVKNIQEEIDNNRKHRDKALKDFDNEIARLQAEYDSKKNKTVRSANDLLRRIERLRRIRNNTDADYANRISSLEARVEKLNTPEYRTSEQRRSKMQEYTDMWEAILGDTSTWKDLSMGISYKTKTMRRFLRKVVKDANGKPNFELADQIYDELETKYDHHEALLKQESVKLKEVFKKLDLNQYEDTYAHMMGEFRHNPQSTLTEEVVKEYYNKHKSKINTEKVDTAITEARKTFDDLLVRVNEVLREQGMKEIPFRQGYFPHFTNPKQGWLAKLLNWKPVNTEIPTSIAGLTEQFEPQRSWQGFNKQRKGDTTDYSLYQGLDTYIHGALDWIYHIEDLQKRRSLENYLRFIHSEEGIKKKIDAIKANEYYDADEAQQQIDLVLAEAQNPLNNLVTELRARTNTLANKKASMDRGMEEATNRKIYSVMTNLNNRINANMVVGSVSSALTNFIPMVQSWHQVSPVFTVRGLRDMIRSTVRDDGMVAKSDYLTNRLVDEEKLYQTGWDKVSDKAAFLMNAIDNITSQTVWRSKYLQNIKEGMSENDAIKDADQFAKNLMAGRSRGNAPSIYDAKNPLIKLATAFQLEVANQYGYMFEDVPQDASPDAKGKLRLAKGYATAMVGAYVYNALYSSLVGRDVAFDPIAIIEDLFGDLFDDDEDEDDVQDALLGLGENILQEIPYVGGLLGGGRVPMSSALPYSSDSTPFESMLGDIDKIKEEGNWTPFLKEILKPLYYIVLPFGGGQIKKTNEGIAMFDDDLPISGSYTDSGKLRFPVEKTVGNVAQAVVFGQYASKNARDYFDNGWSPLGEKQIDEYIDLDIPIRDYREYRAGISSKDSVGEKLAYIDSLDLPISKKNILANNVADRTEPIDMADWGNYDGLEEYDYAMKYPEKHQFLEANGITVEQYNNFDEETKDAWSWAYKNPKKYAMSKAVTSDLIEYRKYAGDLSDIRADKDSNGKTISGSAKQKKLDYINSLNIDYGAKLILYKSQYKTDNMYNYEIVEYLNSIEDFTYEDRIEILEELGFTIVGDGTVQWD